MEHLLALSVLRVAIVQFNNLARLVTIRKHNILVLLALSTLTQKFNTKQAAKTVPPVIIATQLESLTSLILRVPWVTTVQNVQVNLCLVLQPLIVTLLVILSLMNVQCAHQDISAQRILLIQLNVMMVTTAL